MFALLRIDVLLIVMLPIVIDPSVTISLESRELVENSLVVLENVGKSGKTWRLEDYTLELQYSDLFRNAFRTSASWARFS